MKVLYLYSGVRKDKFKGKISIDYPDTQFYGLSPLSDFGIEADFKEFKNKFLSFRLRHFFSYFLTQGYDLVFGSSLLFTVIFKKIFRSRRKFVLFNLGITRTLSANKNSFKLRLIRWLLKEIDAIVCLASTQVEYLKKEFPFLKGKLFFVPLGVDVNFYKPNFENRKKYFLSVGRDNGRDYKTVVETAFLMPEDEFHIVCSERNLIGVDNVPLNVKIFYDIDVSELNKKYHEAQGLLLITHDDSFLDGSDCSGQTVLLDAMACGLPVIASRKKYLNDYTEEGEGVLLVDFYNPNDVREKIQKLGDKTFSEKIAKNARKKVEEKFSTREMAKNLSIVFNAI